MKMRWLVAFVAGMVATSAVVGVVLIVQERKEGVPGDSLVSLIVSSQRIEPNEPLDPLIERGVFVEVQFPQAVRIDNPVTNVEELRGTMPTEPIRANEQIPTDLLFPATPS